MRKETRKILTNNSQTAACCLILLFFLITAHEAEACAPFRLDVWSAWRNLERVLGGVHDASYAHETISPLTNTSRQRRNVDDSQAENFPLNPEKQDESQATMYCKDGNSYKAVGRSWVKNCIKYECTRYGIAVINQTHPPCPFLKTSAEVRQECRSVIVQGDDNCCQGLECPNPEEKPIGASNCLPGWTEFATPRSHTKSVCLKLSSSKRTFDAAARDCRRRMASLIDPSAFLEEIPFLLSTIEILRKAGIQYFWTGLHSRGGFYYWDKYLSIVTAAYVSSCRDSQSYPSVYLNGVYGRNGERFGWDCGQPSRKGTCAKVTYRNASFIIESAECEENLHYVCLMESESWHGTSHIAGTNSCQEGWLFSPETKKCYKFYGERKSTFNAMSTCQRDNATMTVAVTADQAGVMSNALPVGSTTVPQEIHAGLCLTRNLEGCSSTTTQVSLRYKNGTLREWFCGSVNNYRLPRKTSQLVNLSSCYRRLPFVCEKDASGPTVDGLKVSAAPGGQVVCTAARHGAVPGSYISWIRDGLFLMRRTEKVDVQRQTAFTCYTTDLNSGERIFSPILVTGQDLNDMEELRMSVRVNTPSSWLQQCLSCAPGNIDDVLFKMACDILKVESLTDKSEISWNRVDLGSVTYSALSDKEIMLVLGATYVKQLAVPVKRRAATAAQQPAHVSKLPDVNDLSRVLESELRITWANLNMKSSFRQSWNATLYDESITIRSLRFCNHMTIATKDLGLVTVTRSTVDSWYNLSMCISTGRPLLSVYCQANFTTGASWITVINNQCPDVISDSELKLKLLNSREMNGTTVAHILPSALQIATSSNENGGLSTSEIVDISSLVKNALSLFTSKTDPTDGLSRAVTHNLPALVSQIMRASQEHLVKAEELSRSSTTLTKALEEMTTKMMDMLENGPENQTIRRMENNIAITVTNDPLVNGIGLHSHGESMQGQLADIRSDSNATEDTYSVMLTVSAWAANQTKSFIVYNNNKLFMGRLTTAATDVVLAASFKRVAHNAEQSDIIRTNFINRADVDVNDILCGFWSYSIGDWSTDGCRKVGFTVDATTCACIHATSFAILMSSKPRSSGEINEIILSYVTKVGLSISILSLLIVMGTFLVFRRMRQALSQKVLFNLSVALCSLYIVFAVGINMVKHTAACTIVAVLLHYFLLSSFAWMAVEAILQYFRFVKVIGTYVPRFMIKAAVPAWGIPALIVGIVLITDFRLYSRTDGVCWVQESVLYFGVILPIAIILTFNSVAFTMIMRSLLCQKTSLLKHNHSELQMKRLHARAAIAILVVMGLTWTFGFLVIQQAGAFGLIFEYLFCIFNSVQGFLILCLHCAREQTVIKAWKNLLKCRTSSSRTDDVSLAATRSQESKALTSVETLSIDGNVDAAEDKK